MRGGIIIVVLGRIFPFFLCSSLFFCIPVANNKKILYLALHRPDRSPSQRYRIECYADYWQQAGFELHHHAIISAQDDAILYRPAPAWQKMLILCKMIARRTADLLAAKRYDVIIIQREAFMLGTIVFEKSLHLCTKAKIIFDFDDAIWLPNVSEANKRWEFLKNPQKTAKIIALADTIVAGNRYLQQYALQYNPNVHIIPSAIDLRQYDLQKFPPKDYNPPVVTIGWMGSETTIPHFETILPALEAIYRQYGDKIRFKVVGKADFATPLLPIAAHPWTPDTEVAHINSFDIGIMPLPDDEWSKGKCAMKALQYMAMAVPTIAQKIGANVDIIQDTHNGLLANSQEEWIQQLKCLIDNPSLRQQIGKAGRQTLERSYSVQSLQQQWVNLLQQATNA